MIRKRIWETVGVVVLACTASSLYADLNQQQFVEAVGVLGLDPDSMSAAGVSEEDLSSAWSSLISDDAGYSSFVDARDQLRAVLDALSGSSDTDQTQAEIDEATATLNQLIEDWRGAVCSELSLIELGKVSLIATQGALDVPVYLRAVLWSESEQAELRSGYKQMLRNQRMGQDSQSDAFEFFNAALSLSEVIIAKANWDARRAISYQRFAVQLSLLD